MRVGRVIASVEVGQVDELRGRGGSLGFSFTAIEWQDHVRIGQGEGGHADGCPVGGGRILSRRVEWRIDKKREKREDRKEPLKSNGP